MYKTKKDVDKLVENLSLKLSGEEFQSRAYSVAHKYFDVGDYANCQKYVEQYLTYKDNAAAYKLLGQALLKMGQKEKALEQFKASLDIDPAQITTVLDICELLADDEVIIDPGRAKYWCEKAEATFPTHPVTFRLRERIIAVSNPNPEALINLINSELLIRPKDASLHSRLLKNYLNMNNVKEAFDHACNVEFDEKTFINNFSWYDILSELLKHNAHNTKDWLYQLLLLTVKERLCLLSITETPRGLSKSLIESTELLLAYDQAIDIVTKRGACHGFEEFHAGLLQHHRGQIAFHAATLLLKKAKKEQMSWRDATKFAAPLMLVAGQTVPLDPKVNWLKKAPEKQLFAINRWYSEGTYRCSQSGHYLLSFIQDKNQTFLDKVSQCYSGTNWRDKFFKVIFPSKGYVDKMKSSHFASNKFSQPILRIPRKTEIEAYDSDAQNEYSNSLHHFVWTLMNYKNYAHFKCTLFDMLNFRATSCAPETLNKVDLHAYLYCATLTAKQEKSKHAPYVANDKPTVLPANITELLCSATQMKWWDCAYKFSHNELGTELTDIRATLSRGIEVIRCMDNHGLDPELLCLLGRIFSEKSKMTSGVEEKSQLEERAFLYYVSAIPLLEKLKSKMVEKIFHVRMFSYTHKELCTKEINALLEECKLYVAVNHLNNGEYEKVINIISNLKSPYAYYYLGQAYKKMSLEENNLSRDAEVRSKFAILLSKAKSYAFKALDMLGEYEANKNNTLYSDIQELIEEIETYASKLEPDLFFTVNDEDRKYFSDENTSGGGEHLPIRMNTRICSDFSSTPKGPKNANTNTTNYRTALDSQLIENTRMDQMYFEKIENEIKKIENEIKKLQRRDSNFNDFMDQTKFWFEENRKLGNQIMNTINSNIQNTTDQFKLLKVSVDHVKDQIDDCKNECKDVGELKKQIAELKKEVSKLKKGSSEQAIDESALYNLEEEYRSSDNTVNYGNRLPFSSSQALPQFNQRIVPPFPVPPNPYQFYNQSLYNLYNQYSQFAQSSSVSGTHSMFDPTRSQVNYPGVYPTPPDQMYLDVAHLVPPAVPTVPTVPPVPVVPTLPSMASMPPQPVTSVSISKASLPSKDNSKSLPVNVVITSSDPLPTCTTTPAPVLSVIIPPKHIKGTPHNYQIPMPSCTDTNVASPPVFAFSQNNKASATSASSISNWNRLSVFKTSAVTSTSTIQSLLQNPPLYGPKISSDTIDTSGTVVDGIFAMSKSQNTDLNKSRTISEKSNTSVENYDPCPDFKPIVPLPAEVKVTTGEEDETVIFSSRAKLFRFVDKQWKERGIGEMKLLKHNATGKVRVLMRREQVHKICANHIITADTEIKAMKNETKAYFWVANDFADESVVLEKFCIRFKTADVASDFYNAFENARQEAIVSKITCLVSPKSDNLKPKEASIVNQDIAKTNTTASTQSGKAVIGGFTFSGTPTFKAVPDKVEPNEKKPHEVTKVNVFSGLTFKTNASSPFTNIFSTTPVTNVSSSSKITQNEASNTPTSNKLNSSDTLEEFEPNIDFKPIIPLPALIDQKTGEEDETILFEHRAKLLRFDAASKEWKERGLGNIKLLVHKDSLNKIRLLMRREQIMKICCNHVVTKDMAFQKMPNIDKAVTWCAKDFSEGELVAETFCLRFKTAQLCNEFIEAIKCAQSKIQDESKVQKEKENVAKHTNQSDFGDKFKPKAGSWHCDTCYTNNLENFSKCACCETPKPNSSVQAKPISTTQSNVTITLGWGDKFRPKAGTWECQACFVRNEGALDTCSACNSPKDSTKPKSTSVTDPNHTPKFKFGIPKSTIATSTVPITNETVAVNTPGELFKLNPTLESVKNSILNTNGTGTTQFRFGIPPKTNDSNQSTETSIFDGTGAHKFSFGIPSRQTTATLRERLTDSIFDTLKATTNSEPIDFTLKKDVVDQEIGAPKPALLPTPQTDSSSFAFNEGSKFGFVFKPKTPTKGKSPMKSPQREGEDGSDGNEFEGEDECHHSFTPVIPLPDKVEVVTGEENESQLYEHVAKLYRFTSGEWKERGKGVVKILKHNDTGKLRVVMRRDQVLKICLNHSLTHDINYNQKDDKTWLFTVNDFSEGELNLEHFCLRFKNKDIALGFKEAIDKALQEIFDGTASKEAKHEKDGIDDVVFIGEIQASKEEKEKAKGLMLPENFFTYKSKNPCQGCRGCEDDSPNSTGSTSDDRESLPQANATSTTVLKAPLISAANITTPLKGNTPPFQSPTNSIYGTPTNLEKTIDTSLFRTPLVSPGSNPKTPLVITNQNSFDSNLTNKENTDQKSTMLSGLKKENTENEFIGNNAEIKNSTKGVVLAPPKLSIFGMPKENLTENTPKSFSFGTAPSKSIFNITNKENTYDQKPILFSGLKKEDTGNESTLSAAASIFNSGEIKGSTEDFLLVPSKLGAINTSEDNRTESETKGYNFGIVSPKSTFSDTKSAAVTNIGVSSNKSIFDFPKNNTQETVEVKSIFGDDSKTDNLFTSVHQGSIFGPSALINNQEKIGGSIFASSSDKGISTFGTIGSQNKVFGGENSKFGANNHTPRFSEPIKPEQTKVGTVDSKVNNEKKLDDKETNKEIEKKDIPFSVDNSLSFAELSSNTSGGFNICKPDFQWEGTGQQLFAGKKDGAKADKSLNESGGDQSGLTGADDEYDPHYEPIVPLPDKIVVTTGEEDEEKVFGERCKLYRYDEKLREWKERGIGEMKVLYHPGKKTYRFLLRREQVHKAVLNMLLHMDLELLRMKNSDRAWTWAGRNFAENPAGEQETLAVRFKSVALANTFEENVRSCVRKLQALAATAVEEERKANEVAPLRLPKHLAESARADNQMAQVVLQHSKLTEAPATTVAKSNEVENKVTEVFKQVNFQESEEDREEHDEDYEDVEEEEYDPEQDYEGYYNEEEEENAAYYSCDAEAVIRCREDETTCSHAHVQVLFDQEIYSPKILVTDHATGEILTDMLICTDTEFQLTGDSCTWSGRDFTNQEKTVTVNFFDSDAAMQFYDSCETSKSAAYFSTDPEES